MTHRCVFLTHFVISSMHGLQTRFVCFCLYHTHSHYHKADLHQLPIHCSTTQGSIHFMLTIVQHSQEQRVRQLSRKLAVCTCTSHMELTPQALPKKGLMDDGHWIEQKQQEQTRSMIHIYTVQCSLFQDTIKITNGIH